MNSDVGAQLRKGVVESCVLGLLARESMYGWQLSETLITHNLIASIGTLYPMLSRMRSQGLVSTHEQASGSGPTRKYYRLTPAGTERLNSFRLQWEPFAATVREIVGKDDTHD
ncbi:PadR family transcriptional regulator [Cryobacterium sp. MLB-32]|uniref:PadR family transcriptional regulator n=1 Tax=Cryobacterium sp. MLB-32 TaxID=1529318 RepID=UPI0004E652FF|nr:PadR family transcriptional regulator [Cryobacterium sp. MLB-32]KFF59695.1 PadR family transcriptional regulator [Cryobacterium sp. MLB-32]